MTEYIEYEVPAVGERAGLVVLKPKVFDPAIKYRLIIFNPGIGGRGSGSDTDLDKISKNDEGYTMTDLETAIKSDGRYILVSVQPRNLYENGETEEGRLWALNEFKEYIDPTRVYLTGLSLGGGGNNRYLWQYADAGKKFAAVLTLCPGGNSGFIPYDGYAKIAANLANIPALIVHCVNDATVKPEESTFPLVKKIKEINPSVNVQVILYRTGGHAAWKAYKQKPIATPLDAFDSYTFENKSYPAVNDPIGGFLDFFELNQIGQPAKFLPRLSDPKPAPVVIEPAPVVVEPKPVRARLAVVNGTAIRLPGLSDKVPSSVLNIDQVYKAKDGERCAGVTIEWTPEGNKFVLDIRDVNNYRLPVIVVGPYK